MTTDQPTPPQRATDADIQMIRDCRNVAVTYKEAEAVDAFDRILATLEDLPRTADGVPFNEENTVWSFDDDDPPNVTGPHELYVSTWNSVFVECLSVGELVQWTCRHSQVYSTAEAALAAAKERAQKEAGK